MINKTNNAYITSYSLVCSLGKEEKEILKNIKKIDHKNYEKYIKKRINKNKLYKINGFGEKIEKKFYKVAKFAITNAIKKAKLSKKDRKDLHIFVGSTSMEMPLCEQDPTRLNYGRIGEEIRKIAKSEQSPIVIATACTSSVNALNYASKMIRFGKIKKALVVGLEFFSSSTKDGFESFLLLSKKNIYHPFSKKDDGLVLGEACTAMILEDKRACEDDFKYISSANICDTFSETTSNPNAVFQCLENSLIDSKITLKEIDIIKVHATGTKNNTISEIEALKRLFEKYHHSPLLVALKPFIGHTLGACGLSEIALMLLCIKNGFIPPTLGLLNNKRQNLNFSKKTLKSPKKVNILFNNIGFGGNNTSVILGNS